MGACCADQQVLIRGKSDHHLAQLGQLGTGLVDVGAGWRRDLEHGRHELRFDLSLVLGRDGGKDRFDLAREVERVRVDEHQLFLDPDRERRPCEGVFDHVEAASGRAMRPIMIGSMEVKSLNAQKSLLDTLAPGKRTRLRRLLYEFGPGNGTLMLLPIDQGIEHGPRDFFPNPDSKDPEYQFRLAAEAGYSALACQIGMAGKYYPDYAGSVPLILKVNGKTDIPSSDDALSTCNASVEDAVRLGADAVGYTLYVGSPAQGQDLEQLRQVRQDCDRYGMPLVIWSYPRGAALDAKGGQTTFYAIDYAARMAMEMGADIVKLNMPKIDPEKDKLTPAPYNEMDVSQEEAIRQCVESAGRSLVVLSGGSRISDEKVLEQTEFIMKAGGSGVIYGRNVWQREWSEAIEIVEQIKESLLANVTRQP